MRSYLGRCLQATLRPIVRHLIAHDFDARDFSEIAKLVYVDVATSEQGVADKPATGSAVARITGLTRREVARLRKVDSCRGVDAAERLDLEMLSFDLAQEEGIEDIPRQSRVASNSEINTLQ